MSEHSPYEAAELLNVLVIHHGIHEETNIQSFLRLVEIYKSRAEAAETRVAELEAEATRLREALGNIIFECGLHGMGNVNGLTITTMAQNALKGDQE
jgi:hypothetical protein